MDYQLRLCVIQMSAFVFDDPVVVLRQRFVAAHRDNRVDRYSRRNRGRRQCLNKGVAGRHVVDTPRQAAKGQRHHTWVARDQILHDINEALGKTGEASDLMGYPASRLIAPAVRRIDEDNTAHEWKWLEKESAPQLFPGFVP